MDVGSWGCRPGRASSSSSSSTGSRSGSATRRRPAACSPRGGSAANMTALACARESLVGAMSGRLVVYCADQAHSSIARAARILGFRPDQVRVLPVDDDFRLRPEALSAAMDADARAGRETAVRLRGRRIDEHRRRRSAARDRRDLPRAWCVVPRRRRVRRVCRDHRARARGAGGHRARGLGHARPAQVALPAVRVRMPARPRRAQLLRTRSRSRPTTCKDAKSAGGEVNFADCGMQLSRTAAAIKVWLSIQYFGARGVPRRDRPLPRPAVAR